MPTIYRVVTTAARVKPRMTIDLVGDQTTRTETHTHATRTFHPWTTSRELAESLLDALRAASRDATHELETLDITTDDDEVRRMVKRLT